MDTRVLLRNTQARYESIFNALQVLSHQLSAQAEVNTNERETVYAKMVELDEKLDLIMAHLGVTLPRTFSTENTGQEESVNETLVDSAVEKTVLATSSPMSSTESVV